MSDQGYRRGAWRCATPGCEARWIGYAADGYPHEPVRDLAEQRVLLRRRAGELRILNEARYARREVGR